jgi:hypothetical protein
VIWLLVAILGLLGVLIAVKGIGSHERAFWREFHTGRIQLLSWGEFLVDVEIAVGICFLIAAATIGVSVLVL